MTIGFQVDAYGSPRACHMDDGKALDYLAIAGKPGNWRALAAEDRKAGGKPVIQARAVLLPGNMLP